MANGVLPLSYSTNGAPILLSAAGTPLHVTPVTTITTDRIYLWMCNSTGVECRVTIYLGNDIILHDYLVLANSVLVYVVQGIVLNGGASISATPNAINIVTVAGFVVRVTTGS